MVGCANKEERGGGGGSSLHIRWLSLSDFTLEGLSGIAGLGKGARGRDRVGIDEVTSASHDVGVFHVT